MASIDKRETTRGVRYDVRYRDPTGRAREKAFRRRKDAERFARQVEVDKDRGLFVDPALARTPLAEVAAAWLGSNPGKRGGSWQRDEIVVRRHIVPALGDRPIGSLSPGDVQAVVNRWAAVRAPRTVRREYGVLQSIINHAVRHDMLGRSPCRGINLPKVVPLRRHVVDAAELTRLAKGLGGVGDLGPMVYLGAVNGLRWGEVAGLRVRHLDLDLGTVAVAETVARGRKGVVQVGEPKSDAGRRTLPVPPALSAMLVDHLAALGVAAGDADALLFTDEETGRTTYQGLGFHDLRRASATGLVAAGVDVKTAQAVLGHTDSRVTLDLYAQVVTEQHKAAVEATAARFFDRPARGRRGMQSSDGSDGDSAGTRREGL